MAQIQARKQEIESRGERPKASIGIPADCGYACNSCDEYGDLLMCYHCGYFFCHICKPVGAHER
jgi:uncharacterized UBP type Zn finger protein